MSDLISRADAISVLDNFTTGRCGDCGYDVIDSYKHCPNCGAKLDWSNDE